MSLCPECAPWSSRRTSRRSIDKQISWERFYPLHHNFLRMIRSIWYFSSCKHFDSSLCYQEERSPNDLWESRVYSSAHYIWLTRVIIKFCDTQNNLISSIKHILIWLYSHCAYIYFVSLSWGLTFCVMEWWNQFVCSLHFTYYSKDLSLNMMLSDIIH